MAIGVAGSGMGVVGCDVKVRVLNVNAFEDVFEQEWPSEWGDGARDCWVAISKYVR